MSSNSDKTILVTGVTGQQGGAVARRLRTDGWRVRGLSRDPSSDKAAPVRDLGIELVQADLTDERTLARPLDGVYGVFAMGTPFEKGEDNEIVQGTTLGDMARAAGVEHYVYSSVGGAERKTGIPHFESKAAIEDHLRDLDLPLTIIRPVWFMENFTTFAVQRSDEGLAIVAPLSRDTRLQMVAVDDVAAFVAIAFAERDEWLRAEIEVAGDELTFPEAATALSDGLGMQIAYAQAPWEAVRRQNEDFFLMFDWFEREGYQADIEDLRRIYPELLDFRAWVRRGGAQRLAQDRAA
jgi:uncharacterized protein YbjT (DUF2867 family)